MARRITVEDMEELLIDSPVCSGEFLDGAVCVGGYNRETMERVLYYCTGFRFFEDFIQELEADPIP